MAESGFAPLLAASAAFVGAHLVLSSTPVRRRLVAVVGEIAFLGLYSALAVALLVWMGREYAAAPVVQLWWPPTALKHLSLTLMPLACLLVVAGLSTPSPTAVSLDPQGLMTPTATGILAVTRHPVMWGIALWGVVHVLANGDVAAVIFFGALIALAIAGAAHIDVKRRRLFGHRYAAYAAATSFIPLAAVAAGRARLRGRDIGGWRLAAAVALYGALLAAHEPVFGVAPWAL